MTDRPILFSPPMVRALMEGRKTQTRRVLKPQPREGEEVSDLGGREYAIRCTASGDYWGMKQPPYAPGDQLWVKEAWRGMLEYEDQPPSKIPPGSGVEYDLEVRQHGSREAGRYRHARYMPRWASRLTLLVTDVRVERLQDISEADAIAEGWPNEPGAALRDAYPIGWYANLWNSLHGPDAWDANPWVVAVTSAAQRGNIDA
jgi:hypothetical protein